MLVVRVEGRDRRAEASVSSRRACPTATRRRERDHHAHDEHPDTDRPHAELEGPPSARPRNTATAAATAWIGFVTEETSWLYVSRERFSPFTPGLRGNRPQGDCKSDRLRRSLHLGPVARRPGKRTISPVPFGRCVTVTSTPANFPAAMISSLDFVAISGHGPVRHRWSMATAWARRWCAGPPVSIGPAP